MNYGFFLSNLIEKRSSLLTNAKTYNSFNLNLLYLYVSFVNTTHSQVGAESGAGPVILIYGSGSRKKYLPLRNTVLKYEILKNKCE
jgi:hypothetical protein